MGKFQPGQHKIPGSGRKKGIRNKKSEQLIDVLDSLEFSVPEKIYQLLPQLSPEKQADVLLGLMAYIYPKRKAVELIVEPEDTLAHLRGMTPEELEQEAKKMEQKLILARGG